MNTSWHGKREEACVIYSIGVNILSLPNNTLIGQMFLNEYRYTYGSSTYLNVAQQLQVSMWDGWGLIAGTTVSGTAECSGSCTLVSANFPPQEVVLNSFPAGEAYFKSTVSSPGEVATMKGTFKYRFYNPSWNGSGGSTTELVASYPTIRCDNAVPGQSIPGCIFPDWPGIYTYSLTGPFAELAKHINQAQQSGLPGAYPATGPNTARLRRLINKGSQQANRALACPATWSRPPGKSCDEYPMASTYQGAATGGGTGRTFSWCSVTALPTGVTGSTGWSSCMIDANHNSLGGSDLDTYLYRDQRILDSDTFWIRIAP
ncbi:hypothetical protein FJK98_32030 [Micromonospora sp. HM134]|uniref:hypothetical protein n=1 Tax=Micromonospora sp. HM134 TaxID=2583243 RepID=UPI00119887F3|nr:hypothetical protein [Micromonospora sp. HM134]QDY11198.1 hypothetical protein FJK98_32030 [Micromonospora sp. HM134]